MNTGLRGLYVYSRLTPVSVAKKKKKKKKVAMVRESAVPLAISDAIIAANL